MISKQRAKTIYGELMEEYSSAVPAIRDAIMAPARKSAFGEGGRMSGILSDIRRHVTEGTATGNTIVGGTAALAGGLFGSATVARKPWESEEEYRARKFRTAMGYAAASGAVAGFARPAFEKYKGLVGEVDSRIEESRRAEEAEAIRGRIERMRPVRTDEHGNEVPVGVFELAGEELNKIVGSDGTPPELPVAMAGATANSLDDSLTPNFTGAVAGVPLGYAAGHWGVKRSPWAGLVGRAAREEDAARKAKSFADRYKVPDHKNVPNPKGGRPIPVPVENPNSPYLDHGRGRPPVRARIDGKSLRNLAELEELGSVDRKNLRQIGHRDWRNWWVSRDPLLRSNENKEFLRDLWRTRKEIHGSLPTRAGIRVGGGILGTVAGWVGGGVAKDALAGKLRGASSAAVQQSQEELARLAGGAG